MTEHPGEQFPPDVDPDVEPGFEPHPSEESPNAPDYDTEPGPQDVADDTEAAFEASLDDTEVADEHAHVDPAEVEFGPEFARAPGQEHEHSFTAESAEDPTPQLQAETPEDPAPQQDSAPQDDPAPQQDSVPEDGPAPQDEEQGHPLVEETMGRLDDLRDRPVSEHAEVYADLHERLQSALVEADAEHGDRA